MADDSLEQTQQLLSRAGQGDPHALNELFSRYRGRLKRAIQLRLNPRLTGRVDDSDVLQEAYLEVARHLPEYLQSPTMPFYLWLRHIAMQKLVAAHREHLGAQMRDANREVSLHGGAGLRASTASLAARLVGRLTSPSQAAMRAELRAQLQDALNSMNEVDREVLVLRHFEQLSNAETAQVLGIQESTASKRYLRALERLHQILTEMRILDDG
ncbi:MAG: sigma-70 family RNA polymerase sigma factor [Planctomycetes bacterium]|nr:sigma-70 family RNA polymerase sigma factor [Planctomycetota bacterium]